METHQTHEERDMRLCERIRAMCAQRGWYGPDMNISLPPPKPWPRDPEHDFPFPPATDDQIARTERALGFELPPLLRALYQLLGNGGFGPAYGLIGVTGGYAVGEYWSPEFAPERDGHKDPTLALTLSRNRWRVPLRDLARLVQDPEARLEHVRQPAQTLSLIGWGCNTFTLLDYENGVVYGYVDDMLEVSAPSLAAWLEQWMDGSLQQPFVHGEAAIKLGEYTAAKWAHFRARRSDERS